MIGKLPPFAGRKNALKCCFYTNLLAEKISIVIVK